MFRYLWVGVLATEPAASPAYRNALGQMQAASAPILPAQINHAGQNATLRTLQTSGIPQARQQAQQLPKLYHDREMLQLAQDVGVSADVNSLSDGKLNVVHGQTTPPAPKDRAPPAGWSRLSEQPQKMAEVAQRMKLPVAELQQMLRPTNSSFRAEIYLPDQKVLGPGYKPTLVFKGSAGTVSTADGKSHDTAKEDFLVNNLPQAIGMKTDYYDRAMTLGALMKGARIDFEVAGHSLGGGLASAASAVSGARATVVNAAGLHPETARRFAREHPEVQVKDISQTTTNYQVQGDLLTHGVQDNMRQNMTGYERALLGSVIQDGSQLLHDVPEARTWLKDQLKADLPPQAQKTVDALIDKLASGNPAQLIRDMPASVGQLHTLEPYQTNGQNQIVPRPPTGSLQSLTHTADPLMVVAAVAGKGTVAGHATGQLADQATAIYGKAQLLNNNADMALVDSAHASVVDTLGETQAWAQQAQGELSRAGANVQSRLLNKAAHIVERVLPSAAQQIRADARASTLEGQRAAGRAAAQAEQTRADAHQRSAAIRQASQSRTDDITRALATPDTTSGPLSIAGAVVGGSAGVGIAAGVQLSSPATAAALTGSAFTLFTRGGSALNEALQRHLMTEAVRPSMEYYVRQQEKQALKALDTPPAQEDAMQRLRAYLQYNR